MGQRAATLREQVGEVRAPRGGEEFLICQYLKTVSSQGIFVGDHPYDFHLPSFMLQLTVIILLTRIVHCFFKPLHQSITSTQLIAGIIIGPSFLRNAWLPIRNLFKPGSKVVLHTIAEIGFMFHCFILGVQTDASIVRKAGKKAITIGVMSFLVPFVLGQLMAILVDRAITDRSTVMACKFATIVGAVTAFPVVTSLLADFNILNSEIGRLATYAAMVADGCSWLLYVFSSGNSTRYSEFGVVAYTVGLLIFIVIIFFVLKPLILWLTRNITEDESLDEFQLFCITVMVLGCAFISQFLGLHIAVGPLLLGLALPDGPPVGASLVDKFDSVTNQVLLPPFFALAGIRANFYSIGGITGAIIEVVMLIGYTGKFLGTLLTAVYFGIPFRDALSLALILICKGIVDVAIFNNWRDRGNLNEKGYSLQIFNLLVITGIARIIICHLYDPSRKYMTFTRRTVQHAKQEAQLRTMACLHNPENVISLLRILEACHPSRYNPILIFVLHLMELTGRASTILTPQDSTNLGRTGPVIKAFNRLEQQYEGSLTIQHFTAAAPYASMHDDVCTVALEKRATLILVPFHKQWAIDGTVGSANAGIRLMNSNVINKAPCSVGVLVDREPIHGNRRSLLSSGNSKFRIGMLFLGGPDDPEALAFSLCMAEHPNAELTVVAITPEKFMERDFHLVTEFGPMARNMKKMIYKEKVVADGEGTTELVRAMENDLDLLVVGKQHEVGSPMLSGLQEWSDCPELGVLGDMLTTWDFKFSVLIVQQHPLAPNFKSGTFTLVPPGSHLSAKTTKSSDSFDDVDLTPVHSRASSSEFL